MVILKQDSLLSFGSAFICKRLKEDGKNTAEYKHKVTNGVKEYFDSCLDNF